MQLLGSLRRVYKLFRMLGFRQAIGFVRARLANQELFEIRLAGVDSPLFLRPRDSDIYCLWQIFHDHDCHIVLDPPPKLIIDGGANVGYASVYLAIMYPQARILAVEPDPANLELLEKNCHHYPNIEAIRSGIWGEEGALAIENPNDPSWMFRVVMVDQDTPGSFSASTIQSILRDASAEAVDLLKLDIEGAELNVFCSEELPWLERVQALVIETHGSKCKEAVDRAMSDRLFDSSERGDKTVFLRRLDTV